MKYLALLLPLAACAAPSEPQPAFERSEASDGTVLVLDRADDADPRELSAIGDLSVFEAWARAGWGDSGRTTVRLLRGDGPDALRVEIDIAPMLAGDTTYNVLLRPGDRLVVL